MAHTHSDTYYRELCDTLGVALMATDLKLIICTWNLAAAHTFGAGGDRMIGAPLLSVIPQDYRSEAQRIFESVVQTGETIQFEFPHRDDQGDRRELAATVAPVISGSGERIGISVCVRDITKRITMQGELAENRKMIALGEMAGAVAHHFNNILGGIVTSLDYVRTCYDPVMTRRVLDQAQDALQRATSVVDGLLAFSEGNRRAEDLSDFTEIILELNHEVESSVEGKNITYDLQMETLPVIPYPRIQVLTGLRNIIRNAIEAMPTGGELRMEVTKTEKNLLVKIRDTGCGLDEESQSRIFEPFWTTKGGLQAGSGQSSGLGLAITHGVISMLGGSISVTSQPDSGSTFLVTLPLPKPE